MPALEVDHAALLKIVWTSGGTPAAVNVLGIHNPTNLTITQAMADNIGAAVKAGFVSSGLAAQVGTAVALQRVSVRPIHDPNLAELPEGADPVPGLSVGNLLPPQTSLVVTLRTAFAGRSFRGRCYLWGFTVTQNTALGTCEPIAATAAKDFIDRINFDLVPVGFALAVVSRPVYSDAIPPVLIRPGQVNAVTSTIVRDNVWDTQRRRAIPGI